MVAVPKPVRGKSKRSSLDKCMKLAKQICRHGAVCRYCGKPDGPNHWIEAAHIVSCRYWNTAADTWNLIPLGSSCHSYFTTHPKAFSEFMERESPGRMKTLEAIARVKKVIDWEAVWDKLVGEAKRAGLR